MPSDNSSAGPTLMRHRPAAIWLLMVVVTLVLLLVGCDLSPTDSGNKQRLPTPTPLGTLGPDANIGDQSTDVPNALGTSLPTRPRPTKTATRTRTPLPTDTPTNTPTVGTPIPTHTPTVTLTPFPSPTAFQTSTPVLAPPTVTPRATDTSTTTPTITATPSDTATITATLSETATLVVAPPPTGLPLESPSPLPGFLTPVLAPTPGISGASPATPFPEALGRIPDIATKMPRP